MIEWVLAFYIVSLVWVAVILYCERTPYQDDFKNAEIEEKE